MKIELYSTIEKGLIAYLLKKFFVLRNTRRSQKEYPADLEFLKGNRREQEEENVETSSQVPKSIANDDMNVDTPSKTATRLRQITTVNVEKSWTFPKKSWISTQKKLDIDPKKVGHKKY